MVFSGIILGSWLSSLPMLVMVAFVLRRTLLEDRMLCHELPGYADYARNVRYRLIPWVF